jgi:large subunit ribosomal protein L21
MKYAIIEAGGKQYVVAREGETIDVDRLAQDVGDAVQWKDVLLMVEDSKVTVGTPWVKGASVKGVVVDQFKAPKILVFKYKSRERYRRRIGHRQRYTKVQVDKISLTKPRKKPAETEGKAPTTRKKASTTAKSKTAEAKSTTAKAKTAKKSSKSTPSSPKKTESSA